MIKKWIGSLSILALAGCSGAGDYEIAVNDKYQIVAINTMEHDFVRKYPDGAMDNVFTVAVDDTEETIGNIVALDWDEAYLIAKSEDTEEVGARHLKHRNPQYWIFDLEWEKPYGPLDLEAFLKLKAQKGIDLELVPYDKRIKGEELVYD
ncbi:hypothetical protein BMT55_08430 [Listeria newyorkensis]|uniref:DUF3997 domain-containing protein n=1 Tax=Listeria newyorkensis TaxID=1497681 RepID=A0ABX4XN67_9LIST|nr:hypothetical protein [Listeria newyorkensis]KGL44408.1 hypothetical protein EP58_04390 [Listeria newyorkensis]KMT61583.1 hypothetical protein X559_2079 [Listeria newyorkensis]PNP92268.1 hypothetical protein BMT55_08430 [Listeria newyorkensis]WAO20614.1 hypothetical protein OTR81_09925 [Listeria newyorkensis]SQC56383.1 Uncharacterised protein [Listeria newyorkensis]